MSNGLLMIAVLLLLPLPSADTAVPNGSSSNRGLSR